ncbi:thiol disulfide reductase thioredoxin [Hahella sp. CCB-MM4]|uniref:thioredoxin TrxC n=1 Tax=Hahella sp. (strain CCB-MM4) TaxID=1926491 RepID=UPI000B9A551C|nr:thioredoxin TrxC [Hahella sp. CCB-MM4]OZG74470.1 thiol disulfide reductase thioredoxin [Hahella sp. CCB-MM4]
MSEKFAHQSHVEADNMHIVCGECDSKNRVPTAKLSSGGRCGRCKQPLFSSHVIELTAHNFHKHLQNDIPVLVDFWAPWCGPCKTFAPIFAQAAQILEPRLRCVKVDTEQWPQLAQQYQIRSIPTLVLFRGGREQSRQSGVLSLPQLQQWLQSSLQA